MKKLTRAAETAKMIRGILKTKFPKTNFSVRCKNYLGTYSVDIDWNLGPTIGEVESIVKTFRASQSITFDTYGRNNNV